MSDVPFFANHYCRPDLETLTREIRALAERCVNAVTAEAFVEGIHLWNKKRATIDTNRSIARVRYEQNTLDEHAKTEQDFWNEAAPLLRELDVLHARTVSDSPHRNRLDTEIGPQFSLLSECASTTFAPELEDAIRQEARLMSRYTELCTRSDVCFRGKNYSMSGIAEFLSDADRQVRLEAQCARSSFLAANAHELESIFSRMVALRHGMGLALGHENFIELGYKLLSRPYGPDDVAVFRKALCDKIVPLAQELHRDQGRRLGVEELLFHDEPVWDLAGNPRPIGGTTFILDNARDMYHELGAEFGEFIDTMLDKRLFDVEVRDGKAGGGFCAYFADLGVPFVFANFNGTDDDLAVITHEFGHAFQAYASRQQPFMEYVLPTSEAAEVHSMGMEFLTYPWMERFFGDDAGRYRRVHLEHVVTRLPYFAAIDHFQHEVYAQPSLTNAQRNDLWLAMERAYLPHRNYAGLFPHLAKGTLWQRQAHVFDAPFYFIDYALAQVCALQIWRKAEQDRASAVSDYVEMCRVGGSCSFLDMLEVGGLRSPFDPRCIQEVVAHIEAAL